MEVIAYLFRVLVFTWDPKTRMAPWSPPLPRSNVGKKSVPRGRTRFQHWIGGWGEPLKINLGGLISIILRFYFLSTLVSPSYGVIFVHIKSIKQEKNVRWLPNLCGVLVQEFLEIAIISQVPPPMNFFWLKMKNRINPTFFSRFPFKKTNHECFLTQNEKSNQSKIFLVFSIQIGWWNQTNFDILNWMWRACNFGTRFYCTYFGIHPVFSPRILFKWDNEIRLILTLWIECDVTANLGSDSTVQISESIRCFSRVFQWNKIMKSDWFWHCELTVMCLQFWNQILVCKFRNPPVVFG